MAFRPIDEIPKPPAELAKTIRRRIRDDIAEAEKQGVYKFEFVGDYNFKTLAQTAREEADRLNRDAIVKHKREKEAENPANKDVNYNVYDKSLPKKYTITSIKTEKDGIRRVFCEIHPENIGKGWEMALKLPRIHRGETSRPKLKLDYYEGDADGIS